MGAPGLSPASFGPASHRGSVATGKSSRRLSRDSSSRRAMSIAPRLSQSARLPVGPSTIRGTNPGKSRCIVSAKGSARISARPGGKPMIRLPTGRLDCAIASSSATSISRSGAASAAWSRAPASVSCIPREVLPNSFSPSSSSNSRICRLRAGCAMPRTVAERVSEPSSATRTK